MGRAWLTPEERQRRIREGRCIYCSQLGHFITRCPLKGAGSPVKESVLVSQYSPSHPMPTVTVSYHCSPVSQVVVVDLGADVNLKDVTLARELSLDSMPLSTPLEATALNSQLLWQVTHHTTPVTVTFPDRHSYFGVSLVSSA